jgi:hypothetical protein
VGPLAAVRSLQPYRRVPPSRPFTCPPAPPVPPTVPRGADPPPARRGIAVSQAIAMSLRICKAGWSPHKVEVIRNGIDIERFQRPPIELRRADDFVFSRSRASICEGPRRPAHAARSVDGADS